MFDWIRILSLTVVFVVGCYRLKVNFLVGWEKAIYIIASLTALYFSIGYTIVKLDPQPNLWIHDVINLGWMPLSYSLVAFMLYYRRQRKIILK